ncbi:MAG TPA: hypothetical protein VGB53_09845 [Rubricoccaceae bacterium]
MCRSGLTALVAVLISSTAFAQTPGVASHRFDRLSISLPASFRASTSTPPQERDGVRHHIGVFEDVASGRLVIVTSVSGLSRWQRVTFKRGIGHSGSANYSYDRVPLNSLPLSAGFAELAGVAYTAREAGGGTEGLLVRGCDDETCYEVAVQGPAAGAGARGASFAGLLSGVAVGR